MYMDVVYSTDVAAKCDYARVRLNWNVDEPLRVSETISVHAESYYYAELTFERLCGFFDVCGRLTHDSRACLIQNGGINHDGGDDDSDVEDGGDHVLLNHGVIIEEINEEEQDRGNDAEPAVNEENPIDVEGNPTADADEDDELWISEVISTMYFDDLSVEEMYNPINPFGSRYDGREAIKRKAWLDKGEENKLGFSRMERGESSEARSFKRKKEGSTATGEDSTPVTSEGETNTTLRGAVGPKPPLPS